MSVTVIKMKKRKMKRKKETHTDTQLNKHTNHHGIEFVFALLKGIYYCQKEIIKGLTVKGQFQYLTKLQWPQMGNFLYTTKFLSLR